MKNQIKMNFLFWCGLLWHDWIWGEMFIGGDCRYKMGILLIPLSELEWILGFEFLGDWDALWLGF